MNFFRHMGQSVDPSAVTTMIARRSQYHQSVVADYTASDRFHNFMFYHGSWHAPNTRWCERGAAQEQALGRLCALVQPQARFSLTSIRTGCWQWVRVIMLVCVISVETKMNRQRCEGHGSLACTKPRSLKYIPWGSIRRPLFLSSAKRILVAIQVT
jgi:uncharacterized membrane protein YbaN (DUF454 family)